MLIFDIIIVDLDNVGFVQRHTKRLLSIVSNSFEFKHTRMLAT